MVAQPASMATPAMTATDVVLVLEPDTDPEAETQDLSRPLGPLNGQEKLEAVRAVIVALLDLHHPKPLPTMFLQESVPWRHRTRVRGQLDRLAREGLIRRMDRTSMPIFWASTIDRLPCEIEGCTGDAYRVYSPDNWTAEMLICRGHGVRR